MKYPFFVTVKNVAINNLVHITLGIYFGRTLNQKLRTI